MDQNHSKFKKRNLLTFLIKSKENLKNYFLKFHYIFSKIMITIALKIIPETFYEQLHSKELIIDSLYYLAKRLNHQIQDQKLLALLK